MDWEWVLICLTGVMALALWIFWVREGGNMDGLKAVGLGATVEDRITGFSGVVTGRVEYVTGCAQMLVQPHAKPDGDFIESRWFDETRVVVLMSAPSSGLAQTPSRKLAGADRQAPLK